MAGNYRNQYTGETMFGRDFSNKYLNYYGTPKENGYVWSRIGYFIPEGDYAEVGIFAYAKLNVHLANQELGSIILGWIQSGLDIGGLVPGFGEIADGANALIYTARGDYVNAGLSLGAMIPLAGWGATGAKATKKTIQITSKARTAEQALELGSKILKSGYAEIKPGVFRSADGLRQFRMTDSDLIPLHNLKGKATPHVHFELYSPSNRRVPYVNYHVPIINP